MPFKIIETIENGKFLITTVPALWESRGTLFWPRKNESKLKKNEHSKPESNWKNMPCILKRDNIATYEEAEQEIAQMSDVTDTDQENISQTCHRPQQKTPLDFNELAQQCLLFQENEIEEINAATETIELEMQNENSTINLNEFPVKISEEKLQKSSNEAAQNVIFITEEKFIQDKDVHTAASASTCAASLTEKIDYMLTLNSTCLQNQKVIFDHQQNILKKLALLDTKIEEYFSRSYKTETNTATTGFKIISSKDELDHFEKSLSNPVIVQEIIKNLSVICSTGKNRGHINAYSLIDVMFSRQFMTKCSWSGGTRQKESKICFKEYIKTIDLFFKIIHNSDSGFTKPDCDNFLKNVMRHSLKRNEAKMLRLPAPKRRSKKILQPQDNNNETAENVPDNQNKEKSENGSDAANNEPVQNSSDSENLSLC